MPLHIETGRYKHPKTPENLRFCIVCTNNSIENEIYFLLHCNAYNDIRHDLENLIQSQNNSENWSDLEKFSFLVNNDMAVKSTAQFIIKAYNKRSTKI